MGGCPQYRREFRKLIDHVVEAQLTLGLFAYLRARRDARYLLEGEISGEVIHGRGAGDSS